MRGVYFDILKQIFMILGLIFYVNLKWKQEFCFDYLLKLILMLLF